MSIRCGADPAPAGGDSALECAGGAAALRRELVPIPWLRSCQSGVAVPLCPAPCTHLVHKRDEVLVNKDGRRAAAHPWPFERAELLRESTPYERTLLTATICV